MNPYDREFWALALSIERQHGRDGSRVIAEKIGHFALDEEPEAVAALEAGSGALREAS